MLLFSVLILWAVRPPPPDPRIEALRLKGYPVTLAEFDTWYPRVPEADNRAMAYMQAFASPVFTNNPSPIDAFTGGAWLPPRGSTVAPEDRAELADFLEANQAILLPLYSAANASRYPVNLQEGLTCELPHLARCKSAVNLLRAAALLHASEGQTERAVQDIAAVGRLADSLAQEPVLISQLVRFAGWSMLTPQLERVLNLCSLNEDQLARLQALLELAERPRSLARSLAGEQAMGLSAFGNPRPILNFNASSSSRAKWSERIRMVVMVDGLKLSGYFAKDRTFYLGVMRTNIAVAELPLSERIQASQKVGGCVPPSRGYVISSLLLPGFAKCFTREADTCARLRTAQAALALERFRLAHTNALPRSLTELVPAYLKTVPADPYGGQPLRFRTRNAGYVIYSVGQDGKDDIGAEYNPTNAASPHDISFIMVK